MDSHLPGGIVFNLFRLTKLDVLRAVEARSYSITLNQTPGSFIRGSRRRAQLYLVVPVFAGGSSLMMPSIRSPSRPNPLH